VPPKLFYTLPSRSESPWRSRTRTAQQNHEQALQRARGCLHPRDWQSLGSRSRGSHLTEALAQRPFKQTGADEKIGEVEREIRSMKGYTVFNVEQIEGLPESYQNKLQPRGEPTHLIDVVRALLTRVLTP